MQCAHTAEYSPQKLISLVHNDRAALGQVGDLSAGQVKDTPGRGYDHMDRIVHTHNIVLEGRASCRDHALDAHVLSDFLDDGGSLQCELAGRYED